MLLLNHRTNLIKISCQKLYDGTKFTTLAVVVCSALQFQLYILLLRQPSEELLETDISFLMLSFIAEYTTVFYVYLNLPQSPQPRVNIFANFGKVFCAITIIAALVSQPLYRWGIVDLNSSLLVCNKIIAILQILIISTDSNLYDYHANTLLFAL